MVGLLVVEEWWGLSVAMVGLLNFELEVELFDFSGGVLTNLTFLWMGCLSFDSTGCRSILWMGYLSFDIVVLFNFVFGSAVWC